MPTLTFAPGTAMPGQFGPMRRDVEPRSTGITRSMSMVGMPSVMQTIRSNPAAMSSRIASAANGGGTKMQATFASVAFTASAIVLKTGTPAKPSTTAPARPGVTPAATVVPASAMRCAWKAPWRPVIPCTTTRAEASSRMLIARPPRPGGPPRPWSARPLRRHRPGASVLRPRSCPSDARPMGRRGACRRALRAPLWPHRQPG